MGGDVVILSLIILFQYFPSWLERFIEDGGMQVIAKELGAIHKKPNRYLIQVYS